MVEAQLTSSQMIEHSKPPLLPRVVKLLGRLTFLHITPLSQISRWCCLDKHLIVLWLLAFSGCCCSKGTRSRVQYLTGSKVDRTVEPREGGLMSSASWPLESSVHPWNGETGGTAPAALSQACQGRRDISRWHSGTVPVERKQYGAQDSMPPPPLQPGSPTYPLSPTSSQYGLFHPVGSAADFFLSLHPNSPRLFSTSFCGFLIFLSKAFVWAFQSRLCSRTLEMLTQQCFTGSSRE